VENSSADLKVLRPVDLPRCATGASCLRALRDDQLRSHVTVLVTRVQLVHGKRLLEKCEESSRILTRSSFLLGRLKPLWPCTISIRPSLLPQSRYPSPIIPVYEQYVRPSFRPISHILHIVKPFHCANHLALLLISCGPCRKVQTVEMPLKPGGDCVTRGTASSPIDSRRGV